MEALLKIWSSKFPMSRDYLYSILYMLMKSSNESIFHFQTFVIRKRPSFGGLVHYQKQMVNEKRVTKIKEDELILKKKNSSIIISSYSTHWFNLPLPVNDDLEWFFSLKIRPCGVFLTWYVYVSLNHCVERNDTSKNVSVENNSAWNTCIMILPVKIKVQAWFFNSYHFESSTN